jgi:hypothetical protein
MGTMEAAASRADLKHDPEKWTPIFGPEHALTEE